MLRDIYLFSFLFLALSFLYLATSRTRKSESLFVFWHFNDSRDNKIYLLLNLSETALKICCVTNLVTFVIGWIFKSFYKNIARLGILTR